MSLFLGIDGGQSSTSALIGDADGRVIGWARGGPCNHVAAAEAASKFRRVIGACVEEACRIAALDSSTARFTSACCGMSGGPADKTELLAQTVRADRLLVKTDGEIAVSGAFAGAPGIIVVAGTGSIGYGRNQRGEWARSGGWGYAFGDEGSAFDITRQALRAALRFEEGWGPPTALREAMLEAAGARDANQLLHLFYTDEWPRSRVASLAQLVDGVSAGGDFIARAILEQAAQNLASLAAAVYARILTPPETTSVAPIGGVFRSASVRERFAMLVDLADERQFTMPLFEPVAGALIEAYRAADREVSLSNVPRLKAAC